ncbi:tryptamine 5-hydroxylase-like [Cornus florida]|uniref:tryptamine 5-hydroxylase-like n=1 Tax=Cornus florida TaxID=4283 RepID=UPI0028A1AD07|nr:tryptamine 5-hydroxylase-like [Cornus florida]
MDHFVLQVLFMAVVALATFVLLYVKRRRSRTESRPESTLPSPPKLPIIGHIHLLTGMPHHAFGQLARKLGPIIYLQLGQVPTLVISSAQLARLVLRNHDQVFGTRPRDLVAAKYLSFGCTDITFSPSGPYWRQARKICAAELLSQKRVNSFELVRDEEVNRLVSTVLTRSGSEVDMRELLFTLSNNTVCRVAFGKPLIDDSERKNHELMDMLTETQALLAGFFMGDLFPKWDWVNSVSGLKRRLKNNMDDLSRVVDEIVKEHVKKRETSKKDFVDVLLCKQKEDDDLEVPITDDGIKAILTDIFVAGTDTTSATLEWTMTELVRHPRVMKKAQNEVRKIAGSGGKVNQSHLQHLHYLRSVLKETMRLHPVVPLVGPRESTENCILNGYEIPAKTRVLINAYAIGRDAESWENPLEYNPERFEDTRIDFRDQDFRFLPFGGGLRSCPGYFFGLASMEIALARLLYHFDWALPHGVGANDVNLEEIFGRATRKKSALILLPTANKDYAFKMVETE